MRQIIRIWIQKVEIEKENEQNNGKTNIEFKTHFTRITSHNILCSHTTALGQPIHMPSGDKIHMPSQIYVYVLYT